jgi:pSer/pThr/pTyr-binding forkhead associated (FHA) protein
MAKLVVLSAGMTGLAHELKVDKTTIGRVEDNSFQIAEASVSSHHCEILLRGEEVLVRDLNSTNGTFINGEKVTESVLKPGQTLRLGQIELRLETGAAGSVAIPPASGTAPAAPAAPAPSKKPLDHTIVLQRGVNLNELEQGTRPGGGFDTKHQGFSKKDNKINKIFIIGGVILGVVILGLLIWVASAIRNQH